jgi:hypothetical protein
LGILVVFLAIALGASVWVLYGVSVSWEFLSVTSRVLGTLDGL